MLIDSLETPRCEEARFFVREEKKTSSLEVLSSCAFHSRAFVREKKKSRCCWLLGGINGQLTSLRT